MRRQMHISAPLSRPARGALRRASRGRGARRHGVALLEVVLALAVFFGVAITILGEPPAESSLRDLEWFLFVD